MSSLLYKMGEGTVETLQEIAAKMIVVNLEG